MPLRTAGQDPSLDWGSASPAGSGLLLPGTSRAGSGSGPAPTWSAKAAGGERTLSKVSHALLFFPYPTPCPPIVISSTCPPPPQGLCPGPEHLSQRQLWLPLGTAWPCPAAFCSLQIPSPFSTGALSSAFGSSRAPCPCPSPCLPSPPYPESPRDAESLPLPN